MKTNTYILAIVLTSMMAGCTEEVKVTPFTYPQLFTGEVKKGWTLRSVQLLQKGKGTQTFRFDTCVLDDLYIFYNNPEKSLQVTEGATKCEDNAPGLIADSNWSFVNTSATLTMVMPLLSADPLPFILSEIDEGKMVLDIYLDDSNTANYRFNFKPASVE